MRDALFVHWFEALQRRHLATLTFPELRRAVQALSSLYVERRGRIDTGSAFSGLGKRAAFAVYFGPLHFLLVREIVRSLGARVPRNAAILDLGCGTGVAGAAWSLESGEPHRLVGVDRNGWVLQECRWTYEQFGLHGTVRSLDISTIRIPPNTAVIAAFAMNELDPALRDRFRSDFIKTARSGAPVLIVEPVARRLTPWWDDWAHEWKALGGREDEWRFQLDLPEAIALMDKAAGLDHRELTGRSLWLPGAA
jgi:Methyltransferase domain